MAREEKQWLTTFRHTGAARSLSAALKHVWQHWALVALALFGFFLVAALLYQPPMEMSEPGDTNHAIRGLIGYPHGPGAADQPLDEVAFDDFLDETVTETYAKARADQIKLLLIALLTALVPLT